MNRRNIIYGIHMAWLLTLAGGFAACSTDLDMEQPSHEIREGMVPLEVKLPGQYAPIASRATSNAHLEGMDVLNLPEGSTLRLVILKGVPTTAGIKDADIVKECVYVVQTNANGESFPYPCEVNDDGSLKEGSVSKEPYYLPLGTESYYCMAISPAIPFEENESGVKVFALINGKELLATNNHWSQTQYSTVTVPKSVTEKAEVALKPLMNTTARIRVTVKNGAHVTELSPSTPILEVSRIGTNPGGVWTDDSFNGADMEIVPKYNLILGDTIKCQMGNNNTYNRMYVDESTKTERWTTNADSTVWKKDISLMAQTPILPIDARPTPMIIRLNVMVDLTPMQFHYQVREKFLPGHTYNYTATIQMSDAGIYVASWQDASWTATLKPE